MELGENRSFTEVRSVRRFEQGPLLIAMFQPGDKVRLVGLRNMAFNGAEGTVAGRLDGGRHPVRIDSTASPSETAAAGHPTVVRVKPENLQAVAGVSSPTSSADGGSAELRRALQLRVRELMAKNYVEEFVGALEQDLYPAENVEKVFGVRMESGPPRDWDSEEPEPIGTMMYNAWTALYKGYSELKMQTYGFGAAEEAGDRALMEAIGKRVRREFGAEVEEALLAGSLPTWFQAQVHEQLTSEEFQDMGQRLLGLGSTNRYLQLMELGGFGSVEYDTEMLARISGQR